MSEHDELKSLLNALLTRQAAFMRNTARNHKRVMDELGRIDSRIAVVERYHLDTSHNGIWFENLEDNNGRR